MRTITNDYRDTHVLDLGTGGERGPFLVTQMGMAPRAERPQSHMFVLRPDGQWVDFNAYASQGKPELMDELVFRTIEDVMKVFGRLPGRPQVLELPIDKEGLAKWLERQADQKPLDAARAWAVKYRERHRDPNQG